MKVLMFGWEFPPHISGGLGTACQGLTEALGSQEVNISFVIPKLFGGESATRVNFIDAGRVVFKTKKTTTLNRTITAMEHSSRIRYKIGSSHLDIIEIDSPLKPYYTSDERSSGTFVSGNIENWNYELSSDSHIENSSEDEIEDAASYTFSGNYGPDLMQEVRRYAAVAALLARQNEFDVIHAHDWMTFPAGIAAKYASNKPLVVHVHSTEYDRSGEQIDKELFAIEYEGLQRADKIVAVSQWTKDILTSRYEIASNKIAVLHNGIVPKVASDVIEIPWLGRQVITFMGRLTYQKGPLYFVNAAQKVLEKFPDAHFLIAGSGDLFPLVIERVAHLRLSSRFHFTGFLKRDNIEKVWAVSSVYVMPSVSEPFGITPLEAIQAGVPVIVSNQSGVSEVMPHAIKVDFWKTDELSDAICNVLAYKSLSATLQKNAREEIKNITWDTTAKKIKTIYHELITRP